MVANQSLADVADVSPAVATRSYSYSACKLQPLALNIC